MCMELFAGKFDFLLRRSEQFDDMPIGIIQEELAGAIGPFFSWQVRILRVIQVSLPFIEIIDAQREMVAAIMRKDCVLAFTDDVQFLHDPQAKPGAGKSKRRPGKGFQVEDLTIKPTAGFHVLNVHRHMI